MMALLMKDCENFTYNKFFNYMDKRGIKKHYYFEDPVTPVEFVNSKGKKRTVG
jgi:hypothetical protein